MNELHERCLNTFPDWLRALSTDVLELSGLLRDGAASDPVKRYVAGGLNYVFKSLDLIPDGIEDLGFLDDAFVVRVAASLALAEGGAADGPLGRLAADAALVRELLEGDYARLEAYVKGLTRGAARGRTVDEIVGQEDVRATFLNELAGWSASYAAPSFTRDEKNIVKLKAFLGAKLPSASGAES